MPLIVGLFLSVHPVAASPVFSDSLNSNSVNPANWNIQIFGTGPTVSASNQGIEVTLPPGSVNDPQIATFAGGLGSKCLLSGDFDAQVDFNLLIWPQNSGVRVGLVVTDAPTPAVERTAWGPTEGLSLPREVYLTHFADSVQGITATTDMNGSLRMTRSGGSLTGYFHSSTGWIQIHTGPSPTTSPVRFGFRAWSHNGIFGGNEAQVAFTNFVVSSGQLLCPSFGISPASGPVGTQVQVRASGFPVSGLGSDQVVVSFDDQFLGVTTNMNGNFSFTFDVPIAQPGLHLVHASDRAVGVSAVANFTVTLTATLSISVDVGTLYFPGDTAAVYTLATLSGTPLNSTSVQLQVSLTRPDGSIVTLNNTLIGPGTFKSTYTIPKTGPAGTYAIIAKAHVANAQDASALATFEVKPSWLSSQGPMLTTAAIALSGVAAVGAVIWKTGVLRSKRD